MALANHYVRGMLLATVRILLFIAATLPAVAQKESVVEIERDRKTRIGGDDIEQIAGSRKTTIMKDNIETVAGEHTVAVGKNRSDTYGANYTLKVGADMSVTVGKKQVTTVASRATTVTQNSDES